VDDTAGRAPCYRRGVPPESIKDRILNSLRDLPADASFEDAIERIVFLAKVEEGLAQLDAGEGVPHDQIKRRLGL
jgi:predicted transcriptional regulator